MDWKELRESVRAEVKEALAEPGSQDLGETAWTIADNLTPIYYKDILALADERFRECYLEEPELAGEDAMAILEHRVFELLLKEAQSEVERQGGKS